VGSTPILAFIMFWSSIRVMLSHLCPSLSEWISCTYPEINFLRDHILKFETTLNSVPIPKWDFAAIPPRHEGYVHRFSHRTFVYVTMSDLQLLLRPNAALPHILLEKRSLCRRAAGGYFVYVREDLRSLTPLRCDEHAAIISGVPKHKIRKLTGKSSK